MEKRYSHILNWNPLVVMSCQEMTLSQYFPNLCISITLLSLIPLRESISASWRMQVDEEAGLNSLVCFFFLKSFTYLIPRDSRDLSRSRSYLFSKSAYCSFQNTGGWQCGFPFLTCTVTFKVSCQSTNPNCTPKPPTVTENNLTDEGTWRQALRAKVLQNAFCKSTRMLLI